MSIYLILLLVFLCISGFFIFYFIFNHTIHELGEVMSRNRRQTFFLLVLLFFIFAALFEGYIRLYLIGYAIALIIPVSVLFEFLNEPLHSKIKALENDNEVLKTKIEERDKQIEHWENKYYGKDENYED